MSTQPEALRLAELSPYLEGAERGQWIMAAAAELRHLHALNIELLKVLKDPRSRYGWANEPSEYYAAIAKATGEEA